tara:strand:+ start:19347 stop:19490 length:144 start_codon:yes stop_codon:yes gene_type:complete
MSEDEWMNQVEDLLSEKGASLDYQNDGWFFMFENGWTPEQAVNEMFS